MRKIVFLIVVAAFALFNADRSLACSCNFGLPSHGFDRAQAVFTGKVIKAKKSKWTVVVDRVWKGEVEKVIMLRDAHAGTSCRVGYKKGESRLFLVDIVKAAHETIYYPQICNWGTRLKAARLQTGEGTYAWVEDLVLKDRGEGKLPIKREP